MKQQRMRAPRQPGVYVHLCLERMYPYYTQIVGSPQQRKHVLCDRANMSRIRHTQPMFPTVQVLVAHTLNTLNGGSDPHHDFSRKAALCLRARASHA